MPALAGSTPAGSAPIGSAPTGSAPTGSTDTGSTDAGDAEAVLAARLRGLALPVPAGLADSPWAARIDGVSYAMAANEDRVASVRFDLEGGLCRLTLVDDRGTHRIDAGFGAPVEGETTMTGFRLHHQYQPERMRVLASAIWLEPDCLCLTWRFVETAFCDTVLCRFAGDTLRLDRRVNTNAGGTERPTLLGRQDG